MLFFTHAVLVLISLASALPPDYDYCNAGNFIRSTHHVDKTLQLAQIITRHGDRTPDSLIPNDSTVWNCTFSTVSLASNSKQPSELIAPMMFRKKYLQNREVLPGNCASGQLTDKGFKQHQYLGNQIRLLYINEYGLMPSEYNIENIYVRCTEYQRTFDSAMGSLSGLFPIQGNRSTNIPTAPVYTVDLANEYIKINVDSCPKLKNLDTELKNSTAWKIHQESLKSLTEHLKIILKTHKLPGWGSLGGYLSAQLCHNLPWPAGITEDMYEQIMDAANWEMNYLWMHPEYSFLGIGEMLGEMYENIVSNIQGETIPYYYLYSGHDDTIGGFLANLGLFDGLWPPYASHIALELWRDNEGHYFVQMKYNKNVLMIPGCSHEMCPFDDFEKVVATRIPNDIKELCSL